MKVFNTIMKIVAALAVVAGIVYVVAKYGDKIVAWTRKLVDAVTGKCCCGNECVCDDTCCCEEAPEEAPAEGEVQATDADFEG